MSSKQLQSILKNIPSATAKGERQIEPEQDNIKTKEELLISEKIERKTEKTDRIVAEIPRSLKKQIRKHLEENQGLTEKTVILKALKLYGFEIDDILLLDKRTLR